MEFEGLLRLRVLQGPGAWGIAVSGLGFRVFEGLEFVAFLE